MMYRETLNVAAKDNIDAISLMVAVEVKFQLDKYNKHILFYAKNPNVMFEEICEFVEHCYIKSEGYSIENIAYATCFLIYEEHKKLFNLTKTDVYNKVDNIWR